MSAVSLTNLLGTFIFEKYLIKKDNQKLHFSSLFLISLSLIVVGLGVSFSLTFLTFFGLVLIQLLEPVWSTTNQVMIRKEVDDKKYGEFFGYFRILRSLFTFGGIFFYGLSQEHFFLKEFIYLGSFLIVLPTLFTIFPKKYVLKERKISC